MSKTNRKNRVLVLSGLLALLCSCDAVKYIAINNNEYPRQVTVNYNPDGEIYWESDTLNAGPAGGIEFDTILVRQNIDKSSYTFLAPANKHVELMPKGKGYIITKITFQGAGGGDTTLTVNLTDKEEMKRLSKKGVVQWYGAHSDLIIINKGDAAEPASTEETPAEETTKTDE